MATNDFDMQFHSFLREKSQSHMISNRENGKSFAKTSYSRCSFGRHNSEKNLNIHTGSDNIFGDVSPT